MGVENEVRLIVDRPPAGVGRVDRQADREGDGTTVVLTLGMRPHARHGGPALRKRSAFEVLGAKSLNARTNGDRYLLLG